MSDLEHLEQIAEQTTVLFSVKAVFPFDLFPARLTIEQSKIEYTDTFFIGNTTEAMLIPDISTVTITTGFFLATIEITSKVAQSRPWIIGNLPKSAAQTAVDIIQGLMVTHQAKVDVGSLPPEKVIRPAEKIGANK